MVATRGHPEDFSEVDTSPSKPTPTRGRKAKWAHTPSNLTLIWIIVSLPLIAWDTGYVMLRPHSMPGGWAHSPVWKPYKLYGTIDYIYGWKAFNEKNGFTAAQGLMNIVESLFYIYYVYILYAYGKSSPAPGRGAPKPSAIGFLGEQRHLAGKMAGVAVLVLFSGALMTLSKTILYWLNEYYSGFSNIGHNDLLTVTTLWIIPNGAWIVLPTYMIYVSGAEILQGLAIAAGGACDTSPALPAPEVVVVVVVSQSVIAACIVDLIIIACFCKCAVVPLHTTLAPAPVAQTYRDLTAAGLTAPFVRQDHLRRQAVEKASTAAVDDTQRSVDWASTCAGEDHG